MTYDIDELVGQAVCGNNPYTTYTRDFCLLDCENEENEEG